MKSAVASRERQIDQFYRILHFMWMSVGELTTAAKEKKVPFTLCLVFPGTFFIVPVAIEWDVQYFIKYGIPYPRGFWYQCYVWSLALSGFFIWGSYRATLKMRMLSQLTNAFRAIGLTNTIGDLPEVVSDYKIDNYTRLLRLTRKFMPKSRFENEKDSIESALQIYIDEIKEDRETGTLDIIYGRRPMPSVIELATSKMAKDTFIVGSTRSGQIETNLQKIPHLLIAGQTGGGKSTAMRQLLTSLYISNPDYKFSAIDLKGGLEFQLFRDLPRVKIYSDTSQASSALVYLEKQLEKRQMILKKAGCSDIGQFLKLSEEEKKKSAGRDDMSRHVIAVDEIAELFLGSSRGGTSDLRKAREALSRIARLGRALGLHLVAGTQRPDSSALDPQTKANLIGKLCFQMGDIHSSQVVLGNARAKYLPAIPGRAIWQTGDTQIELQVPFLSTESAEKILNPLRAIKKENK